MRYTFCTIAIGEKYINNTLNLINGLNEHSDKHHFVVVTDNDTLNVKNTTFITIDKEIKLFIKNSFNYNLKYLPIKFSSEMDFEYVIFIDADWSLNDGYSHNKIMEVLTFMENNNYDFCFERPHLIGEGKTEDDLIFWKHKRDFYNLLETNQFDDGHVVNEQFLIFKNNEKLKTFSNFWEGLCDKATKEDLWAFAEGVEIGMSSSVSKMSYEYYRWQKILTNCFNFTTVDGKFYNRF
jgi:hypothetical protein